MSQSLSRLRGTFNARQRLFNYSMNLGKQGVINRVKGNPFFTPPPIPPRNYFKDWWYGTGGGGGGGKDANGFAGVNRVWAGNVPDPHVDERCLNDIIEGYLTVHYWNLAYEQGKEDGGSSWEGNWQVNNDKLPGMTGGSRCMDFGRQLATFEIDNWELVDLILDEAFSKKRLFELIGFFKGNSNESESDRIAKQQRSTE